MDFIAEVLINGKGQRDNMDYGQQLLQSANQFNIKQKKQQEEDAQKHTFSLGSLLTSIAAVVGAPFTGGASLAMLPAGLAQAGGEGIRAMTGGDTNYGSYVAPFAGSLDWGSMFGGGSSAGWMPDLTTGVSQNATKYGLGNYDLRGGY